MSQRNIPDTLRAENTKPGATNGKNLSQDKELVSAYSLVAKNPRGEMVEAVVVRCWMSRSRRTGMEPVRATIWVHGDNGPSGHGTAGGCGYHKESAAIAEAVASAGLKLYGDPYRYRESAEAQRNSPFDFSGTGSSAYPEIFVAIARACGYDTEGAIFISHS